MIWNLCQFFQQEAVDTWNKIGIAHDVGLPYGEETITETILLNLRLRYHDQIKVWSHNKQSVEPHTGADWEWWFGHDGAWFGMRVQAKKISVKSESYGQILTYTTPSQTKPQISVLIEKAHQYNMTPLYCLYTHSRATPSPLPNCMPSVSRRKVNGCLIGHAEVIQRINSNKLVDLAPNLVPWHFLVCECAVAGTGGSLAFRAQGAVRESLNAEPPETDEEWLFRSVGEPEEIVPFVSPVQSNLPHLLMDFLGASASVDFVSMYAEERQLAGVVILRSGD